MRRWHASHSQPNKRLKRPGTLGVQKQIEERYGDLDEDHFVRLSAFLTNPKWESTNNAAERGGRAFRHGQHPHFRLRLVRSIEADLEVRAYLQKERFCSPRPRRLHRCQRGRHPPLALSRSIAS